MARQKLNYTQGDAEPKKKANQKRSQLATGQSTGDVSQVDLSFKTPQIQNFKWYGQTYSTPTEPKLVPTLDLPSVEGFYDDTKKAKDNLRKYCPVFEKFNEKFGKKEKKKD